VSSESNRGAEPLSSLTARPRTCTRFFASGTASIQADAMVLLFLGSLTPGPPGVSGDDGSDRGGARLTERLTERFLSGLELLDASRWLWNWARSGWLPW
jgi:hypothetical protein